jgi:hypothetical protein
MTVNPAINRVGPARMANTANIAIVVIGRYDGSLIYLRLPPSDQIADKYTKWKAINISKMNTKRFTISITTGIAIMLLLIVGTARTSILSTTYAQSATLGEPFFVEKGKRYNSERNWP